MKLWEPQPKESSTAFAAFVEYRDLGSERSQDAVAAKLAKSRQLLSRWAAKYDWVARAIAYDAHLDSVRLAAREQSSAKHAAKIMTAEEVKQGLTRIAEADIAEIFEPDGTFDLASAKKRGASKLIKSLTFDKDTGRVTKVETYSAHEGHRDMARTHAIFVDKSEIEDKTPLPADTLKALKALAKQLSGQELSDEQVKELMAESFKRIEQSSDLVS